jgi:serine/threonine-protein kinase
MDPLRQLQTALSDRYHVERQIGVGGMATVFLARDLRHERPLALKLLKPELGAVLGVERFLSEIRVTANLQHPHLLPLFDSGEADGLLYYVMPFVEGESLRGRLDREKQLPVNEAIRITVAVAGALDYAHRHHVVHRDLKPENILLQDGQPVVSDFGIALAVTNAGGTRVTQTGLSLGTPAYMSPEQATGDRLIDARSDIYSLAAVLYEMLTGEPPHTGSTVQAIIARVLTDRVRSVRATRDTVPENVDAALQRALAKLPADRFETAKEFAEALQDPRYSLPIAVAGASAPELAATRAVRRVEPGAPGVGRFVPWVVAAAGVLVAAWSLTRRPPAPDAAPPGLFRLSLPDSMRFRGVSGDIAVSSDGARIALVVNVRGSRRIAVRPLNGTELRLVDGTDGASRPFFSPDGATLGFTADGRVRSVSLTGSGIMTLAGSATSIIGAAWSDAGVILGGPGGLTRLPAGGGAPEPFTRGDSSGGELHVLPSPAPDGHVVFVRVRSGGVPVLAAADREGNVRELGQSGLSPTWIASGHVLYSSLEGNLMALPVDDRLTATGTPILLLDAVRTVANGIGLWSASSNGTIVVQRTSSFGSRLVIVERSGRSTPLSAEEKRYRLPRVSPDGSRIAVQASLTGQSADAEIWILDRRTSALSRFTTGGGNSDPVWTPNGDRLAWAGRAVADSSTVDRSLPIENRAVADIWWQRSDRSGSPELLVGAPRPQWPWSFTPDGRTLVFDEGGGGSARIRALEIGPTDSVRDVVANEYSNRLAKLSPDGRWLAYTSNETGRFEVYVRPFPGPGGAIQVSVDGGDQPVWSRDGRELFYRDGANMVSAGMAQGTVTTRSVLFADTFDQSNATNYDVLPGGGFVMLQSPGEAEDLTVLVNWISEIRRRSGAGRP